MQSRTHCPRPEYPRPDRQRSFIEGADWLNLNGPWEFRFDGDNQGWGQEWFARSEEPWREQIIVPFCWESLAAWGEEDSAGNENYYATRVFRNPLEVTPLNHRSAPRYEIGWYRRTILVPDQGRWSGRRAILTIGAADFFTDCWCNGKQVGHHEGGYTPFDFDLTDALEPGPEGHRIARLVVRVEDPMANHEQPVGKQWRWYTTTSGIWQTVFIEPRPLAHLAFFQITTDIATSEAVFQLTAEAAENGSEVLIEVTAPDAQQFTAAGLIENGIAEARVKVHPLHLWDNNDPRLYRVKLTLLAGSAPDEVWGYFGMRSIGTAIVDDVSAPSALTLNGQPIYLRGALYQSYHPDGIYTAGDARTLKNDILSAKDAGFDFLRVHIKIDDPVFLYYADTLGILLMCDFPNFGEGGDTPRGRERFETMMRAGIRRDFNHPSIIAWCLFNETWGFGGQVELVKAFAPTDPNAPAPVAAEQAQRLANESSLAWVQQMWNVAKELDPTRLVEDMSVVHWLHLDYYAHGKTDINSWHFYINDYTEAKAHIENVVGQTYAGSTFNYSRGFEQAAQPLINSEYGGVGALDGDRDVSWSFKFLTNELRLHPSLSAYIYTELHDVEWEYNGFLNYDRTRKDFGYNPEIINQGDVLPINAPPITRCAPGGSVSVEVWSSHYSRRRHSGITLQWHLSGIDSLGRVHQDLVKGSVPIPFTHLRVEHAHDVTFQLPEQTMLCTLWVLAITSEGITVASNFVQYFVSSGEFPRREEREGMLILRAPISEWTGANWRGGKSRRAEAAAAGYCYGHGGSGFFEWALPLEGYDLSRARTLRILCEASSRRHDTPQTDDYRLPTSIEVSLNGVPVCRQVLPNHPHDARGALSYLRGGRGAYGYLLQQTAEGPLLREIAEHGENGLLRLRCAVPSTGPKGGLTIYEGNCGRYPIPPTVVID